MKRLFRYRFPGFMLLLVFFIACKDHELEDFKLAQTDPTDVSATSEVGAIVKSNERITIPLSVSLSTPAGSAFQVGIQLNVDTVLQLIENGELSNTVALAASSIELPNVVQIPFGASSATFEASISITALERLYGKQVAMAFNLIEPGKGNRVGTVGSNVVTLNTLDLLEESDIHYLSITNGGAKIVEAQNRQNYVVTSGGLSMPLGITLAGVPGASFTVTTEVNTDTIATLVAKGVLPKNTIALKENQYRLDTLHRVGSNESSSPLEIIIPWEVMEGNMDNLLALSINLKESSRHVIHEKGGQVVILIHPSRVVEVDVTNNGIFSVSRDNNDGPEAGEGSLKLIDGDYNSKFLQGDYNGDLWVQLVYKEPQLIGAYSFTSGNDASERDPKDWNLEGSMDGENWTQVDQRTNEGFENRLQTRRFDIDKPTAYTHYRMNITANHGNNLFQMTEWRMIRVP